MVRKRWILLGLLLGAVVAGVAAFQNSHTPHPDDYYLHVSSTDADQELTGEVVVFDDLTAAQQRVFLEALHSDSNEKIPDGVNAGVWIENAAVEYQNQTYEVSVAMS